MSEQEKQESQKTVVSFIAGLLIGGLLVWVFGGTPNQQNQQQVPEVTVGATTTDTTATGTAANSGDTTSVTKSNETSSASQSSMQTGKGSITVDDQKAGLNVQLRGAIFPVEDGWLVVRTYTNGQLGRILGAARFSKSQGLVPDHVELLAPTVAGQQYAVVFFSDDGTHTFNLAHDSQIGSTLSTFNAQ